MQQNGASHATEQLKPCNGMAKPCSEVREPESSWAKVGTENNLRIWVEAVMLELARGRNSGIRVVEAGLRPVRRISHNKWLLRGRLVPRRVGS
jgi:hypothetical protein